MTITSYLFAAVKMEVVLQPEQQPGQPEQQPGQPGQPEQQQGMVKTETPVQIKKESSASSTQSQTIHIHTPGKKNEKYTVKC
jgi:hypothetical protein